MSQSLPVRDESAPVVCRLLRTKMAYANYGGRAPWHKGESATAVFWCLGTMATAGPDDQFADPHRCRPGRSCYQPPVEG